MDRRQRKSREAILRAFSSLLSRKRYEQITVQDIIDAADVGRSTFYAHFETKDMLLQAMCSDIFDHIFAGELCSYPEQSPALSSRLAHILWHLQEHRSDVLGIMASESSILFLSFFRERLHTLFAMHLSEFSQDVPSDFLLNHLVGSLMDAVRWWVENGMTQSPETIATYYLQVNPQIVLADKICTK